MRGFGLHLAEPEVLARSPVFPYHTTPTPENWRALLLDIDDHILFIRQGLRKPEGKRYAEARFNARLKLYPRALRALYEVESKGDFHHV